MTSSPTGFSSPGSSFIFVGVNIKSKTSSSTQVTWCQAFPFWASFLLVAKIPLDPRPVILSAPLPHRQAACLWIELKQSEHYTCTSNSSLSNIFTLWLGYLQCWEGRCPIPRTSTIQLGRGGWKPAYRYKPGCNFSEVRTWSLKLSYKNLIGWYLAYRNINTQTYKAVIGVSFQGPPRRWPLSKYLTISMIFILTYFYKFGVRIWKAMVDLFLCIDFSSLGKNFPCLW